MQKIFLHIGEGKSGSSAIQHALQELQSQGELKKHGIALLWEGLPHLCFECKVEQGQIPDVQWVLDYIKNFLQQTSAPRIIISCEAFSYGSVWSAKNIMALAQTLQSYEVKVLVYYRRQDQRYESSWAQGCRFLRATPHFNRTRKATPRLPLLRAYTEAFGKDNMSVRIYDRSSLYMQDSRCDFLHWAGMQDLIPKLTDSFDNPSLSPAGLRICLSFMRQNRLNELQKKERIQELKKRIDSSSAMPHADIKYDLGIARNGINADANFCYTLHNLLGLEKTPRKNTHAYMTLEERQTFLEQCKEENAIIAREFLGKKDGQLFDASMPEHTIALRSPSTDDITTVMLPILVHLTQRIEKLEQEKWSYKLKKFFNGVMRLIKKQRTQ